LTGDESNGFGQEYLSGDSVSEDDNDDEENVYLGNDDINEMLGECDSCHLLYILEMILRFHVWYKCGAPYSIGDEDGYEQVDDEVHKMLMAIKMHIPCGVSTGWKLQKFHNMLHILRDMQMFGCPQNWDASPGEHNLIDFAK